MAEINTKNAPKADVGTDPEAARDKQRVMAHTWWNSLLFTISDTLKVIAGVLTPVGLAVVLPKLIENTGSMGFWSALQTVGATNLTIAGISLAATALAITVGFASSRFYHSGNFDALEVNAQHTAKYLVKELKKETTQPIVEHTQNCRTDGKSWVQATGKESFAASRV